MNGGVIPGDKDPHHYAGACIMFYRFYDNEPEFLFQQRSKKIIGHPGLWDTTAGGHINYNEPRLDAVKRETKEEIGIDIDVDKLEYGFSHFVGNDVINLFFYDWTRQKDEFKFNDHEAEKLEWIKYSELDDFWPNLKPQVRKDEIFRLSLKIWAEKIEEKYGNN